MNLLLSIIYYEADYVGKSKIAYYCLQATDVTTIA